VQPQRLEPVGVVERQHRVQPVRVFVFQLGRDLLQLQLQSVDFVFLEVRNVLALAVPDHQVLDQLFQLLAAEHSRRFLQHFVEIQVAQVFVLGGGVEQRVDRRTGLAEFAKLLE